MKANQSFHNNLKLSKANFVRKNMSKTLVLEVPDEIYLMFQKQAESKGLTIENFVLEILLKNLSRTNGWIKLSETSFNEWDNNEDAVYDKL